MKLTLNKSNNRRSIHEISNYETVKDFNKLWHEQTEVSLLGRLVFKIDRKKIFSFLKYTDLTFNSKIIDVGCGTGSTLKLFRKYGYNNSIGIDAAKSSIKLCERNGLRRNKDIFLIDVNSNNLKNNFDLVFAEGVIEHYVDIQPIVDSICRISKKYVLTTMPDLSSFYWYIFEIGLKILKRKHAKDYQHEEAEYINAFKNAGFEPVKTGKLFFGWVMLFKRK